MIFKISIQTIFYKKLIIRYLQKSKNNIIVFLFQNLTFFIKKMKKVCSKFGNIKNISVSLCAEREKRYSN